MKYKADGWNNFCRVFELPESFPSDYCFGGGHDVTFKMVDWFCPVIGLSQYSVSKEEYIALGHTIETVEVGEDYINEKLLPFLKDKTYLKKGRQYLVITGFGLSLLFDSEVTNE